MAVTAMSLPPPSSHYTERRVYIELHVLHGASLCFHQYLIIPPQPGGEHAEQRTGWIQVNMNLQSKTSK